MHPYLSEIRRQASRLNVALPVTIRAGSEGGVVIQGSTVDYSTKGLRLRTELPVIISQNVEVSINAATPRPQRYQVIWVREPARKQSVFEAGLKMAV
jgi:PilZ domain